MLKRIVWAVLSVAVLAAGASAEVGRPQLDQDVFKDSVTITAQTIGTTFVQVDDPKLSWSWMVEVQNLSNEQVCCSFDSLLVGGTAGACHRIDTASTSSRPTATDWKRWKRWAQNLSLFCRSLKSSGTAAIIVTQGR